MKRLVCLLAGFMLFTGCDKSKDEQPLSVGTGNTQRIDINEIEAKKISEQQKAEELTLAGEQLMTLTTFQYADLIFDKALEHDSNNKKAIFYKALNAPLMNLKGILKRTEPLLVKDKQVYSQFKSFISNDSIIQAQIDFLNTGEPDIDNEIKLQVFLDEQAKLYDNMRNVFKDMKDTSMVLNLPKSLWQSINKNRARICTFTEVKPFVYERTCEADVNMYKVNMDRADFESLQQVAAGMQIFNLLGGTYNLNGFQSLFIKYRGKVMSRTSDKKYLDEMNSKDGLAELRNDNLSQVKGLGIDAVAGTSWALEMQDKLCGKVKGFRESRDDRNGQQFIDFLVWDSEANQYKYNKSTGSYVYQRVYKKKEDRIRRQGTLFEEGICLKETPSGDGLARALNVDNNSNKILRALELALGGNIMTLSYEGKSGNEKTLVDYTKVFDNPIQDLKTLPKEFNYCGNVTKINNKSLNGVFVNEDAEEVGEEVGLLHRQNCL